MKSFRKTGTACLLAAMTAATLFSSACKRMDTDITTMLSSSETTLASVSETKTSSEDKGSSESETSVSVETETSASEQQVEVPDPVFSRLREEQITDIEQSDDYGEIYIFGEGKYGFFDSNGRIICDPVFTSVVTLSNGDYVVTGAEGKAGFVSHDGSIYTGLKYDDYCIDRVSGELLFLKKTETGFLSYTFNTETGKQDVERGIEVDYEELGIDASADIRLVSSWRDFAELYLAASNRYILIDGLTGKEIPAPSEKSEWEGRFFLEKRDEESFRFFDVQGQELFEEMQYSSMESNDNAYLLTGKNEIDLFDRDLKKLASLEIGDRKVEDVYFIKDCIFLFFEDTIELYDMELSKLNTLTKEKDGYYFPATYISTQNDVEPGTKAEPVLEWHNGGNTKLINMKNGNTLDFSGDCHTSCVEDRLVVEEAGKKWKIMRASDFEVMAEGTGDVRTYADRMNGQLYLESFNAEKREADNGEILVFSRVIDLYSMTDGSSVLQQFTEPGGDNVQLLDIRNGCLLFRIKCGNQSGDVFTDTQGNVAFRNYG